MTMAEPVMEHTGDYFNIYNSTKTEGEGFYGEETRGKTMGKVSQRSSLVSPRRRVLKTSSGVGVKKNRGTLAKACLSTPPPVQSLVDEDSGFGGDQSLDSESSLLSVPGNPNSSVASISPVLPSLTMVPQTKLLLVSLLQGAGDEQGTGTSQKNPGNVPVGALSPTTTQLTISNGTSQTGNTHGAVTSSGAGKEEWHTPYSVGPLVAGGSAFSLQGAPSTEVISELPSVSTNSPSNSPSGTVPLGNTSVKGIYSQVSLAGNRLPVDVNGEEAQELPGNLGCKNSRHVPPLISFRDVSLLSSIHSIRNNNSGSTPVVCVEGPPPSSGRNRKILRQNPVIQSPPSLNAQLSSRSSDGSIELRLINQPEEQHRARYQTEGSRGAVKDEEGKGHPTVKLTGYTKPTVVQVFVGDDSARTSPHMFYQVCRVSGKNSTPCKEKRIDGTAVIEAVLEPCKDMVMSCDCVGILKERNVDVEHRFKALVSRGRKKSTKCRLVFRTFVTLPNGTQETLQVVSRPIACTQPPGVPEICRKSLSSCPVSGGEEIFIFGKNFSKDTVVIFQETGAKSQPVWEQTAIPEKDTLQPIHLIVTVPKYYDEMITREVTVQMIVSSGSKRSEPHNFTYLPVVSKKELQGHEIHEEQMLPKGVSLGALQVNRHYAETRMLPSVLQEGSSTKSPNSPVKMASVPLTKPVVSSVRVPRIIQSSNPARKAATRTLRNTSHVSKTAVNGSKAVGINTTQTTNISTKMNLKIKSDEDDKSIGQDQKQDNSKGTVSLGSLVELLNVVKSLPSGFIEDLVKSMKENITSTGSVKVPQNQEVSDAQENKMVRSNVLLSNSVHSKVQKALPQANVLVPQESTTNKIIPTVTTNLGLWPLTLFPSISTSQSITGGPRVARVAPIAPTTVVSSPGLTRAVRVCVTEAPHVSLEPPKKKSCDHLTSMEYELIERNQLVRESVVDPVMPPPIITQSSVMTYSAVAQPATQSVIRDHCDAKNSVAASQPTETQEPTVIQSSPQVQVETTNVLNSANGTALNTHQEPMYQTMTSSLLQTINQAPQQVSQALNVSVPLNQASVNPPINVSLGQSIQQLSHPVNVSINHAPQTVSQSMDATLNQNLQEGTQPLSVARLPPATEVNQAVIKAEPQAIPRHTTQQELPMPSVPTSLAAPLFNQSSGMGTPQMVVGGHSILNNPSSDQTTTLTPQSVVSSALTHSDPLLSQSVSSLQLDQNGVAQGSTRNQPAVESRQRAEVLMTPSSTATQVSMQNEVTSAISLSETELLNYFDPNCFDNV
ncbi:nuclear factor of activated T-cells 5 isoform X2 [Macrobrachium rosenbergii]|uniref:nuclear factor of activated T-cells 5 isoform X2 n=1 Tax=Macrobrachium rosenbergii TaxID=79674 RepID=UPI0034D7439E